MRILSRSLLLTSLLALLGLVIGCGDSGGGGSSASAGTGRVALALTDGPTDEFSQVLVTVLRIDLLPDDDDSNRETIFEGRETFDLLALENVSEPFAIADDVPAGSYEKLRMRLAEIELIRVLADGSTESVFPRLPGGERIDLNPRGGFEVRSGETLAVRLDVDARRSIQIVGTGNGGYQFRPQVFVDIMQADRVSRLVSIEGVIDEIDDAAEPDRLRVCEIAVEYRDRTTRSDEHCLTVFVDEDTSIFDDSGLSVPRDDLRVGDRVAVLGHYAEDEEGAFAIDAKVIELGGSDAFLTLTGVVTSCFCEPTETIVVELDPGQGFAEGTVLDVSLTEGTRIFNRAGEELAPEDIEEYDRVEIDGVLFLSDGEPDELRAAVVFARPGEPVYTDPVE
jgi:hypothetical protein